MTDSNLPQSLKFLLRPESDTLTGSEKLKRFPYWDSEGLSAAGSSAREIVASLLDSGLSRWEFHDLRLIPVQQSGTYDLIRGGKYVDPVLSKGGERVTRALGALHEQPLEVPTGA